MVAGAQVSLVAAGIVEPKDEKNENIKAIAAAVADELQARESRTKRMAELREQYATTGAE
jgi:hypothetical protein